MATPEGRTKAKVKARIAAAWPYSYRFCPVQNGMGSPSVDFLYCINGLFVAIETKRDTGDLYIDSNTQWDKATPRQRETLAQIATAGGIALVVDSDSSLEAAIDDIKRVIRERDCRQEQQGPGSTSFDRGQ
jgi:hypothetical protein